MKQTALDLYPIQPTVKIRYLDLNINQKINVKANSCGFQSNWLNAAMPWFRKHLGIVTINDHPERLTDRWFLHHKLNKNRVRLPNTTLFQ